MKHIKPWHLFILCIITAAIGVHAVRENNIKMLLLRDEVFTADKAGEPLEIPLNKLRGYIGKHMGTSTEVPLKYSYERAAKKSQEIAPEVDGDPNKVFADLPASCASGGFIDSNKPCVREHINKKLAEIGGQQNVLSEVPDKRLFTYSFSSPIISIDIAGVSLITSAISGSHGLWLVIWKYLRAELAYYKGDIEGL